MQRFLEELRFAAWRTAGDRYNAARRLRLRELLSTLSLSAFSVATIAVAVTERIYTIPSGSPIETALSICLGMCILAISLIEWRNANGVGAEALYRNAEELNGFQRKVSLKIAGSGSTNPITSQLCEDLDAEYSSIKSTCSFNHAPVDDLKFVATHYRDEEFLRLSKKPKMASLHATAIHTWWFLYSLGYIWVIWIVIILGIVEAFRIQVSPLTPAP
jgi:hypothetical protein